MIANRIFRIQSEIHIVCIGNVARVNGYFYSINIDLQKNINKKNGRQIKRRINVRISTWGYQREDKYNN